MSEYIFYTTEGYTEDPQGNRIENCQLIGVACGDDAKEAQGNLLTENPWIKECGYSIEKIICKELA